MVIHKTAPNKCVNKGQKGRRINKNLPAFAGRNKNFIKETDIKMKTNYVNELTKSGETEYSEIQQQMNYLNGSVSELIETINRLGNKLESVLPIDMPELPKFVESGYSTTSSLGRQLEVEYLRIRNGIRLILELIEFLKV